MSLFIVSSVQQVGLCQLPGRGSCLGQGFPRRMQRHAHLQESMHNPGNDGHRIIPSQLVQAPPKSNRIGQKRIDPGGHEP